MDVDNVGFEHSAKSSGILSWIGSNDKEEEVEGYTCRVMNASNVEIVTKTRLDHLTDEEKEEALRDVIFENIFINHLNFRVPKTKHCHC